MPERKRYSLVIVGAGVSGGALYFVESMYSNLIRFCILDKYSDAALVNSNTYSSAQTGHSGSIETNYTRGAARVAQEAFTMLVNHLKRYGEKAMFRRLHKMVLAVGAKEVRELRRLYHEERKPDYPHLELLDRGGIVEYEPKVVEDRDPDEEIAAIFDRNGVAIDYHLLGKSFMEVPRKAGKNGDVYFNTEVRNIYSENGCYVLETNNGDFEARAVVFDAGPYSLYFAQKLGYAKNLLIVAIMGIFYRSSKMAKGKIYRPQDRDVPNAAAHADPPVEDIDETRYGPTAVLWPFFEKYLFSSFFQFREVGFLKWRWIKAFCKIMQNKARLKFMAKNIVFHTPLPYIGRWFFLRWDIRKIFPSLRFADFRREKGGGGIRAQVIDWDKKVLKKGAVKIVEDGGRLIFNTAPAIGASDCLRNAMLDAKIIQGALGDEAKFDEERFKRDFLAEIDDFFHKDDQTEPSK